MAKPIRTCCACGKKSTKDVLQRFVWKDDALAVDHLQQMPGRGAYCCVSEKCYIIFHKQKKKWKRLFRL